MVDFACRQGPWLLLKHDYLFLPASAQAEAQEVEEIRGGTELHFMATHKTRASQTHQKA